jgi:hypothetical protein
MWLHEQVDCHQLLRQPFSIDMWSAISLLPLGLQNLALDRLLPEVTIHAILETNEHSLPFLNPDGTPNRHIHDQLLKQVWYQFPGLQATDDDSGPALERLLALTLLRYVQSKYHTPLPILNRRIKIELAHELPLRTVNDNTTQRQGLLWIWLMLTDAWSPESAEQKAWVKQIKNRFPEVQGWHIVDFERFGQRFFWIDSLTEQLGAYENRR